MSDNRKRNLTPADLDDIRKIVREEVEKALAEGGVIQPAGTEPPDPPDDPE